MSAIIKDGISLDYQGGIILKKQSRKLDNLNQSFTLSYSFELDLTTKNLAALGIISIDQANKGIYQNISVELKQGVVSIFGDLHVERINSKIECSFFSDNYDFLNLLNGNVRDTQFQSYTYSFPNTSGSGYATIPINNGTNKNTWNATAFLNYLPCMYVKEIIRDILQEQSIKLAGDILTDWRYNHTVVSNNSPYIDYDDEFIFDHTIFVGKTSNQSITGASAITFTSESGVYYDNPGWWDGLDDLQTDIDRFVAFELNLLFDTSGAHTISIVGSISGTVYTTTISADTSTFLSDFFLADSGEDYTVFVTPASGTINVLSGSSFKVWTFTKFDDNGSTVRAAIASVMPRFLLPSKEKSDFVIEILSMFNPLIAFDPVSKILTVNFFENLDDNTEEDWSSYLKGYDIDFEETLQQYGKKSVLSFGESPETEISDYNKVNDLDFGAGALNIDNDFIENERSVLTVPYAPSHMILNIAQQAYFPVFSFFPDEDNLDYRLFLTDALSVSDFSNKTSIDSQSTLCYGWFVKSFIGKNIDNIPTNLGFENPVGYQGHGLKEDYFRKLESILNDPVKLRARMYLPDAVYNGLDFSTPKRIKTSKFNSLFFCLSVEGWENSYEPCEVELIKL